MSQHISRGETIAGVLATAWRRRPNECHVPPSQIDAACERLLSTGSAPLAWWRLRSNGISQAPTGRMLRREYRASAALSTLNQFRLRQILREMRKGGVEPILLKGRAVARHYAHVCLRPYSDFDIAVAPEQLEKATRIAAELAGAAGTIDLHAGVPDLRGRPWSHIVERSQTIEFGEDCARILSAEDELSHLCVHFWRHIGCRPLWLCDVAAAVESLPAGFDWEYCLAGGRYHSQTVACVVKLAIELLHAQPQAPVPSGRFPRMAMWPRNAALWMWGAGVKKPISPSMLKNPLRLARERLPHNFNPIRASMRTRLGPTRSHASVQLASLLLRPVQLAARFVRVLRPPPIQGPGYDVHRR